MKTRKDQLNKLLMKIIVVIAILFSVKASAQNHYMRIAKVVIDSAKLENYKTVLREAMHAAVNKEQGVLSLYAVYDKEHPTHVTVFETYTDEDAYKAHIQTAHFKKYKEAVKDMVKSLELTDVLPIALESKMK